MRDQKILRDNLSFAYRACAYLKLDDLTYTHLSAKCSNDSFLIYPFGLLFQEVNPQDLLEVDFSGGLRSGVEMNYNLTGYSLHSMIYENRNDVEAIFHLHTPAIVAVASEKNGLQPLSQWALHFYNNIGYHEYNSLALNKIDHQDRLTKDLGRYSVLMMKHHGAMIVGKTIEEALFYSYHLEKACQTQCLMNREETPLIDAEVASRSYHDLISFEKKLGQRDFLALKRFLTMKIKSSESCFI
jgi:ribulose-5-phosphate 4-epimerase/fuculose-1-phosphate aldolase